MLCPSCGEINPASKNFCGECGCRLSSPSDEAPAPKPAAERRNLTVMFCDLVNSTLLSGRLDPEKVREIIGAYRDRCAQIIGAHDGTVSGYAGDGIVAFFGYPEAHEDTADSAIGAALEIARSVPQIQTEHYLQVRVGIATGVVVVGNLVGKDARERSAIGEAPNLAARLQALAEPGCVLISHNTRLLAGELFEYIDLGKQPIKGFGTAQRVWRVVKRIAVESRFDVLRGSRLAPFIGRDQEIAQLLDAWRQASSGEGKVVLLQGDAGIGKSRLVRELKLRLAASPHTRLTCQGWAHHQHSAFYPLIALLQRIFGLLEQDSVEARLRQLERSLNRRDLPTDKWLPLLAPFLSLTLPPNYTALRLSPEGMKQKIQESLVNLAISSAAIRPVLCVVEDAHWLDPSTLEFLGQLIRRIPQQRVLLVVSARPEFTSPWHFVQAPLRIDIEPLPSDDVKAMVMNIVGGKDLPREVTQQIVRRADGVPLYVEELTRLLLESEVLIDAGDRFRLRDGRESGDAIPDRLQDLLLARMTGLTHEREIANLGAVLGRHFDYGVLRAVLRQDDKTLRQGLNRLVNVGLLVERGSGADRSYRFRHALIQDAAYNALLIAERRELHAQVAQTLEEKLPHIGDSRPEVLARHYSTAGNPPKAIAFWLRAGRRCGERSENLEAVVHIRKALELVKLLPEGPQRLGTELELLMALSGPLVRTRGYGSSEVETVLTRAREICNALGTAPQLPFVLVGLAIFHTSRADLGIARDLADQVLAMNQAKDPTLDLLAHRSLASTLFWQGELVRARESVERVLGLYDRERHHELALRYFVDPAVVAHATLGLAQWLLGHADSALQSAQDGIALGRAIPHPFSLGFALVYAASLRQMRNEHQAAIDLADENTAISSEHAFPMGLAWAAAVRGWAKFQQSGDQEALDEVAGAIALWRSTGTHLILPYFLSLLADMQRARGERESGLATIAEALSMAERTGEGWWRPELYRLRGELQLLDRGRLRPIEAEADFARALDLAQAMRARALEERAVLSMEGLRRVARQAVVGGVVARAS
jgi:class 3 adenylate cyclase/tetratricopeptide (TPR) repeat protein